MDSVLIIGTGGLARELTSWCAGHLQIRGYWSTDRTEHGSYGLPGELFPADISPQSVGTDLAILAIGSPREKQGIYEQFSGLGFRFPSFVHPSAIVSDLVNIGEGVVISPACVVSPNVTLGRLVYLNFSCGIGHDARIGAFTHVNPGVQVGGFSVVGEHVLIGSGSTILQRITIGHRATIGSGSVVFGAVAEGVTVMGNPAKRMRAFEQ